MRNKTAAFFIFILVAAFSTAALAQGRNGGPMYDPKTEVTLKGKVDDVTQQAFRGGRTGTHLMLKTESETLEVHVGPTAYVQEKGFTFAKGDQIEMIGSRVKLNGKDIVIAREITKESKTLTLRDAQGFPAWSGGWRRSN